MAETDGKISASRGPPRTDREANRASRPVKNFDAYSGDGSQEEWIDHFENLVLVNRCYDLSKLLWFRARWMKRAHADSMKEAFCKHFEPTSKWELYSVQFQSKKQRPDEPWANYCPG